MVITFLEFQADLDDEGHNILRAACQEYASEVDRLQNFNVRAGMLGLTPRQVLTNDLGKHILSIFKGVSLREPMRGRIIDAMNYLRLLAYMEYLEELERNP